MFIKFKHGRFTLEVEECVARCVNVFNSVWNKEEWPPWRKETVITVIFVIKQYLLSRPVGVIS
jgi:hypothetical protein